MKNAVNKSESGSADGEQAGESTRQRWNGTSGVSGGLRKSSKLKLADLPDEVLIVILRKLLTQDPASLRAACAVNPFERRAASADPILWKEAFYGLPIEENIDQNLEAAVSEFGGHRKLVRALLAPHRVRSQEQGLRLPLHRICVTDLSFMAILRREGRLLFWNVQSLFVRPGTGELPSLTVGEERDPFWIWIQALLEPFQRLQAEEHVAESLLFLYGRNLLKQMSLEVYALSNELQKVTLVFEERADRLAYTVNNCQ
jgi:hypothetical protein